MPCTQAAVSTAQYQNTQQQNVTNSGNITSDDTSLDLSNCNFFVPEKTSQEAQSRENSGNPDTNSHSDTAFSEAELDFDSILRQEALDKEAS
jgi:hypothetical protein